MIRRAASWFHPVHAPPLSRANYAHELTSLALMSGVVACVTGGVVGVIARKAFNAGDLVVTILAGSEAIANITSVYWTGLLHGRDRVRATNALQIGVIACVLLMALAPFGRAGQIMLLSLTLIARALLVGIVSARTDLWRANYPRDARGRFTGKLIIVATLVVAFTSIAIALVMDLPALGGHGFRPIYALASIVALFGVRAFSRVRWRGRAAHLRAEHASGRAGRVAGLRAMMRILRDDRDYRRFMTAQFVLGAPQLAAAPIFIIALSERFHLGYTQSIALVTAIPQLVPIAVIPLWARLLDRVHIIRFRAWHSWVFVGANTLMAVALLTESLPVLYLSRIVLGVAMGGGMLAWELGHHDFARKGLATIYMGVHVTLTGVRGVLAPLAGTLLYAATIPLTGDLSIPGANLGAWAFLLLAAISGWGGWLFYSLYRDTRAVIAHRPPRD